MILGLYYEDTRLLGYKVDDVNKDYSEMVYTRMKLR